MSPHFLQCAHHCGTLRLSATALHCTAPHCMTRSDRFNNQLGRRRVTFTEAAAVFVLHAVGHRSNQNKPVTSFMDARRRTQILSNLDFVNHINSGWTSQGNLFFVFFFRFFSFPSFLVYPTNELGLNGCLQPSRMWCIFLFAVIDGN